MRTHFAGALHEVRSAARLPLNRKTLAGATPTNADWWPNQLNLKILHQNSPLSDPMDKRFNYAKEFKEE